MKLYKVRAEVEIFVLAADQYEAYSEADRYAAKEMADNGSECVLAFEVQPGTVLPDDALNSIPYGGEGDKTIRAILEAAP